MADAEPGPSLHDRAEAIAERLDRWARAGGRRLPDTLLERLERLIELSMRAAIYTVARRSSAGPERTAAAPKVAPAVPVLSSSASPTSPTSPTGPTGPTSVPSSASSASPASSASVATPPSPTSGSAPAAAAGAHAATDAGHPASAPRVRADARS